MLGLKFMKVEPTKYVLQYQKGKLVREGSGLSFFYFAPTSSLIVIPISSVDVSFMFQEVTSDFQQITVQGQITYRVAEPNKMAQLMNFSLAPNGRTYSTDDPAKVPQRLINHTQVLTQGLLKSLPLRTAVGRSEALVASLLEGMQNAENIRALGIEIMGLTILALKPTPDTARALEAEAREEILRRADEAIYARRNSAVEQERAIKENELNTEIAVENKKRQIKETQMETEKSIQGKNRELMEAEIAAKISIEEKNKDLVQLSVANKREEADAAAYEISAMIKAISGIDSKSLQALTSVGMKPGQHMAMAFRDLAENAGKIGTLNITPELLSDIIALDQRKKG